ncbi:hypothetical protein KO507_07750 [Gilvimarinus agarilyticus]|uniref:hypothetical protein n=1 Tax=Gilvimarinus sp. 2_MG-2023 TaxID=3062666 RepID=UPI001C0A2755|nr:hypothetical protein [Gilvimarinus sp. 2_MG-2023]MBU2885653.1 hypothetical protein [Gilvimarinus agarilyticus]MDO6570512.1 hypothetical protein [Gilvimarinus sp. 2_MG-2023]
MAPATFSHSTVTAAELASVARLATAAKLEMELELAELKDELLGLEELFELDDELLELETSLLLLELCALDDELLELLEAILLDELLEIGALLALDEAGSLPAELELLGTAVFVELLLERFDVLEALAELGVELALELGGGFGVELAVELTLLLETTGLEELPRLLEEMTEATLDVLVTGGDEAEGESSPSSCAPPQALSSSNRPIPAMFFIVINTF